MSKDKKNVTSGEFKLPVQETNLLIYTRQHLDAIYSGILSTLAMRLGYNVTDKTQFKISDDYTHITISEIDDEVIRESKESTQTNPKA